MQRVPKSPPERLAANPKFPQYKGDITIDGRRMFCSVWVNEDSLSIDFQDANANHEQITPLNNPEEDYGVIMTMISEHGNPYGKMTKEIFQAFKKDHAGMKARGYVYFCKGNEWYAGKRKDLPKTA